MASLNKAFIMGNLGQDPELRYTANQTPVVTLSIATTDYRKTPDGQRQEQTEWHRVVVWSRQAENCHKYLRKGSSVFVEGRIQTRSWDDKSTGQKRYSTEIVAVNVQFMPSAATGGRPGQQSGDQSQGDYGYMPAGDPFAAPAAGNSFNSGGNDSYNQAPAAPNFPRADNSQSSNTGSNNNIPDLDDIPF